MTSALLFVRRRDFGISVGWCVLDKRHNRPESLNDAERRELLAKAPALEWSVPLPPTADFKERAEQLPAPATLKPGFYFLIASCNAAFDETNNMVQFASNMSEDGMSSAHNEGDIGLE